MLNAERSFLKDEVAGLMSIGIFEAFEPVEVKHEQPGVVTGDPRAIQFAGEQIAPRVANPKPGQFIVRNTQVQLSVGRDPLFLERMNAPGDFEARSEQRAVEGLGDVVVRTGLGGQQEIVFEVAMREGCRGNRRDRHGESVGTDRFRCNPGESR